MRRILPFIVVLLCMACSSGIDEQTLADFEARQAALTEGDLFSVFDQDLTADEEAALKFLYAYMPLADIVDHSGAYWLRNVDCALKARKEMAWNVPDREWRHFVLPVRVNNEDLDDFRALMYDSLKSRVEGMTMEEAVLEVNHWCHERVIYTPSDARTTSPLASIKTAYGRCGEESTFTVAALRTIGIPARQVYTPRWAHTDDNHAWVEAWVDGRWCFFGACEPEPVLNLGWFNSAASRGMLMHTRVFGNYQGPEEVVLRTARNTEINVIDNYAPATGIANVEVVDTAGQPVDSASVEFKLYNYAEFYTVATKYTDAEGHTSLSAGLGDMLVWASKDGRFGFAKVTFGSDILTCITLDKTGGEQYEIELDITPPAESANLPEVTEVQRTENDRRMALEDSIRNAYVATFMTDSAAHAFAKEQGLPEDEAVRLLTASRGNHEVIREFLASLATPEEKQTGLQLLSVVAQKDLRDVTLDVLNDHLRNTPSGSSSLYGEYVLNPRISTELLTPYKSFFIENIAEADREAYKQEPAKLAQWVAENIKLDPDCNIGACPISPAGVWTARVANATSRDIFFVAAARSCGIAARIDEVTRKVQFADSQGEWVDVNFDGVEPTATPKGKLVARYTPTKLIDDPKYYAHFSISKVTPTGSLSLMNYEEGELDMGGGTTWSNLLKRGTQIDAGNYIMVTGTRLANGGVLARLTSFSVDEGKTTTLDLTMREPTDEIAVIGSFDSESKYKPLDSDELKSILSTTGRGYFVVAVLGPGEEPTNHALRDIAALKDKFEECARPMVLLFPSEQAAGKFNVDEFPGLPSTISYGIDSDGSIQKQIAEGMKLNSKTQLPMFIIGDTFNRVVFVQQGYTIGLGAQIIAVANKL